MRARAWRLEIGPDREPGGGRPAGPAEGEERDFFPTGQEVGYHTAMEYRFVSGAFSSPGRRPSGCAWVCRSWPGRSRLRCSV